MSDREDIKNRDMQSPGGSMSDRSDGERKIVTYRSRSKERSQSRSPTPAHKSKRKYSRSRSRSRSHHKSGRRSSRYRSRSHSPRRYKSSHYSRSRSPTRSRSGSDSPYRSRRYRSHSRSPMSNRRRHNGSRPSRCLGVFGLSIYTTDQQILHIFSKYGPVERVQVVIDAKTGRSRGFCFVYFENYEDASVAKDQCSGMEIDGRKIRVDYSITQRAHTPTPGIYMGKPTYTDDRWRRDRDYGDYYGSYRYRRSPSPYYRRRSRYDRSRSRSYSPRRY